MIPLSYAKIVWYQKSTPDLNLTTLHFVLSDVTSMYHIQRRISPRHNSHLVIFFLLIPSSYLLYNYNVWEYAQTVPFVYFQYPLEMDMRALVDSILREERLSVEQIIDDNFPIILDNDKMCKSEDGEDEIHFILLPPAYGVRGKVMFWQASVLPSIHLSVHRGGWVGQVPPLGGGPGIPPGEGQVPPRGGVRYPPPGGCQVPPGGGGPGTPRGGGPGKK